MAQKPIAVLGATGYTGRLIVRELQRRQVPVLAAARSRTKLQELATNLGALDLIETDVRDPAALERLARRSAVIINTVGPFADLGEPVVQAAITHGAHYLDTTGEQPFVRAMMAYDERAREQGVAVVPAQAFEIAVADCAASVAAEGFRDVGTIQITYRTRFHASQGTQRTVLRMLQRPGQVYAGRKWMEERLAQHVRAVNFPSPVGRVAAVSFPGAEIITIPQHLTVREVRTFMSLPPIAARVISATAPILQALLRSPLSRVFNGIIGTGTDGPDEATRAHDEFHIAIDVRGVRAGAACHRRLLAHGHDPYGLTAVLAARGAEWLCGDNFDRSGVLAPAAAFDPPAVLEHVRQFGLTYEIREESGRS